MNISVIERRQTVTVKFDLTNATGSRFSFPIYIPFTPDELIVKYCAYKLDESENGVAFICN